MARSKFLPSLAFLGLLAGCATAPDIVTQCLPMKNYTAAEDAGLKSAYDSLPKDSPLKQAIQDYGGMRDANRACQIANH